MKKLYLPLLITIILLLASNLQAVEITYNVTSGGNTTSLTTDYDLSAGSRADSQIDITSNPSISSHTTINAQGNENNIEITTEANDGAGSTSNASVRILDDVETASINTNANASNSTSASVNATGTGAMAGVIKGESDGTKKFCAFTGDFNASSDTGGGNVGIASSYTNPKANIFIVTKDKNNTPCHDPVYPDIQPAVDDASKAGGLPDYIFVDQGGYTGADIAGKNNLTLLGVWGADNTTINGRGGGNLKVPTPDVVVGGDTLYVHDSDNFTVEGFTVTGGIKTEGAEGKWGYGISIYNSDSAQITGNTLTENDVGVYVYNSNNTQVTGNTANENVLVGIGVVDSNNTQVTGNTTNENVEGILVFSSDNTQVTGNTANENGFSGIHVSSSDNTQVTGNTANENVLVGIGVVGSDDAQVTGNTVSSNVVTGVMISGSSTNTTVNNNNIFGNLAHGLDNTTGNFVNATNNWWGLGGTGGPGEGGNNNVVDSGIGTTDFTPWSNVKF